MIPTIRKVMKCYDEIARAERMKTGRPGEQTVVNTLRGTENVCKAAGIGTGASVERLTRKVIDKALVEFLNRGVSRLSAWSYVCQLRALFAKWCRPYYADRGWEIPPLDLPVFRAQPPRYVRPSVEVLKSVRAWYEKLEGQMWFAATMMLEFAVRNGDVLRIKPDNFIEKYEVEGAKENPDVSGEMIPCDPNVTPKVITRHYLSYTPHKTELSSGRRVYWPVHDAIWERLRGFEFLESLDSGVFEAMNRQLRDLGFRGAKASYELRKICIDHVYQKFGAEMATSISGDDIKTISRYYADPSQPNIGAVRIVDLL